MQNRRINQGVSANPVQWNNNDLDDNQKIDMQHYVYNIYESQLGENNDWITGDELCDDDKEDINGDDSENALLYKAAFFFSTHRESSGEIDPSYK